MEQRSAEDGPPCLRFKFFIIAWGLLEGSNKEMLCIYMGDLFLTIAYVLSGSEPDSEVAIPGLNTR